VLFDPITTIIGLVFGGCSLVLAVSSRFLRVSRYERLSKELLRSQRSPARSRISYVNRRDLSANTHTRREHIIHWLDVGDAILEVLKVRLARRGLRLIIAVVAGALLAGLRVPEMPAITTALHISWLDAVIIVATVLVVHFVFDVRLFKEGEIEFLRNMDKLREAYYAEFVPEAIGRFNTEYHRFMAVYSGGTKDEFDTATQWFRRLRRTARHEREETHDF